MMTRAFALLASMPLTWGMLLATASGCAPITQEAASARSQALHDDNLAAQKRAIAQLVEKERLTTGEHKPRMFRLGRLHRSCRNGAEQVKLSSRDAEPVTIRVPCGELPKMRGTLWGTLPDDTPAVLIDADRDRYRLRVFDDTSSPGKVTVVTAMPNFTRDEEIVYPGSCDLMPQTEPDNMPRAFVMLRGRAHEDIRFLQAPYDAVRIRRSCENPAY